MGHSIQYYTFDENEDKNRMQAVGDADALRYGDSGHGLHGTIRFLDDQIYEDEDEARKAIERLDKGWYDQLAVKFNHYEKRKETQMIKGLRERIDRYEDNLMEYKIKNAISNRKSNFVGCDECGSRINKKYVNDSCSHPLWNHCPLCRNNLSSETVTEYVKTSEQRIQETRERLTQAIKDNDKKGKPVVKWLVKTEYHI